jgi:VanZ family protein
MVKWPRMQHWFRYWLPVIVWCAIIFVQSAFAVPKIVPDWPHFDKVLHTGVYGLLGLLFCRAFSSYPGIRRRTILLVALATLFTALYGLSDEWHQSFIPARTADVFDLLADLVGGFLGSLLFIRIRRFQIFAQK